MSELKPCPFCGSDKLSQIQFKSLTNIVCHGCQAEGGCGKTVESAIDKWNSRYQNSKEELQEFQVKFNELKSELGKKTKTMWQPYFKSVPIESHNGLVMGLQDRKLGEKLYEEIDKSLNVIGWIKHEVELV